MALLACDHSDGCDSLAAEAQRASASPACVLTLEGVDLRSSKELSVSGQFWCLSHLCSVLWHQWRWLPPS